MTIESSFIPFPSEIVVPPAAWKAAQGELSLVGVLISSTVGAMLGALVNYYLALLLGRPVIHRLAETRLARLCMIALKAVEKAESFFHKHGRTSTLIGRLVPGIRQLISLPAGVARMDLKSFLLFTAIGASLWNVVLAALGYFLYSQRELLDRYYHWSSYALLGGGLLFAAWLAFKFFRKPTSSPDAVETQKAN